ncbi:MAG TPA: NAD(P)-binding domain-containing protein, partial [Gaiellales bacterium]|nr:NAD(P)-binding domain-containing protein [Gaiellales bacterium]
MTRIAVLGAGSWGTTLANLLAGKGEDVRLWAFEPDVAEAINRTHENPVFLAGVALAPELRATGDAGEAVGNADVVVSAPPSHAVRAVVTPLAGAVREG